MPHKFDRTDDVDVDVLRADLEQRLGRPVDVTVRAPQTVDEAEVEDEVVDVPVVNGDGLVVFDAKERPLTKRVVVGSRPTGKTVKRQLDGVLVVVDPATGDELDGLAPATVQAAIRAAAVRVDPAARARAARDAIAADKTLAPATRDALLSLVGAPPASGRPA